VSRAFSKLILPWPELLLFGVSSAQYRRWRRTLFLQGSFLSGHALRHAVTIKADIAEIRDALATLQGLKGWSMAEVSGGGGVGAKWSLKYAAGPTFVWQITAHDADKVSWTCVEGPGDSVGTTVTYTFARAPDGRVRLTLAHEGWPHQEGNFAKCNALWGMMLHQLRAYAEHGRVAPAYA
jgi:uncharacterized protein YndB with AHSA1/START domain